MGLFNAKKEALRGRRKSRNLRGNTEKLSQYQGNYIRETKAYMELNMAPHIKSNKLSFYMYVIGKRNTREAVTSFWKEIQNSVSWDREKCEVLNGFFVSDFTDNGFSHITKVTEGKSKS